jgi:hypothetical protein
MLNALTFKQDYTPGQKDSAGQYRGGTEASALVGHQGKLYAAIGYWRDTPGSPTYAGAQVLVKEAAGAEWRVDVSFGVADYYSTEAMASIELTTDAAGQKLATPMRLLMASPSYDPALLKNGEVWIRDDTAGTWTKTLNAPAATNARVIFSHVDTITGVHHAFAGMRNGTIYRGAYDPAAPGKILWQSTAETMERTGGRVISATVANGRLYAASRVEQAANGAIVGGLYERTDGPAPSWRLVYQLPFIANGPALNLRGLTAVPDPSGGTHEVLIAGREDQGTIVRLDPTKNFALTTEFNYRAYYQQLWGGLGGNASLAAYNDMLPAADPKSGEQVWMIGVWINHPQRYTAPNNASRYLVRRRDGSYKQGTVFDISNPVAQGTDLRATRTIAASPFAADAGKVYYFGGFDAGGDPPPGPGFGNNAWIYRATAP